MRSSLCLVRSRNSSHFLYRKDQDVKNSCIILIIVFIAVFAGVFSVNSNYCCSDCSVYTVVCIVIFTVVLITAVVIVVLDLICIVVFTVVCPVVFYYFLQNL